MLELNIESGNKVCYKNEVFYVKKAVSLKKILLETLDKKTTFIAEIADLEPPVDKKTPLLSLEKELSQISQEEWEVAQSRTNILKPLAEKAVCSRKEAELAAKKLKLSSRQVYNLLRLYRESAWNILVLVPRKPGSKKGYFGRLSTELEQMIDVAIKEIYLTPEKVKMSVLIEEIKRRCFRMNIPSPSARTIRRRVQNFATEKETMRCRLGAMVAKAKFSPVKGHFPLVSAPLEVYQIDHTVVDLIIVDEVFRQPIGRPYITVAIDVYSRCIAGFCLTLEPPSAVSVGLSLTHAVLDKEGWLAQKKIEAEWPIWGKPKCLYVDNGKDFHSEALKRGCEFHGIKIDYRPVGKCHYGGIVERVIGTLMQLVHQLPGTTFSNIAERGDYDSEQKAILTLGELEKWLTIAIAQYYHKKVHSGLLRPPLEQYKQGILGDETQVGCGYPTRIYDKQRFLIDFLPIEHRTIQRNGFVLDHIAYYSHALSPFIANRGRTGKFLIRRDPRDLSHVYVLDPKSQAYIEVPYRTLSRPRISLWEHRQALKYLREKGTQQKDEGSIFQAIEVMREVTRKAMAKTKVARRRFERQPKESLFQAPVVPEAEVDDTPIQPYKDIEWW